MPPEQVSRVICDSVQAELASGTFERDWSSLEFRFIPRHPIPPATRFTRWSHQALGSLHGVMRSVAQSLRHLFPFFK